MVVAKSAAEELLLSSQREDRLSRAFAGVGRAERAAAFSERSAVTRAPADARSAALNVKSQFFSSGQFQSFFASGDRELLSASLRAQSRFASEARAKNIADFRKNNPGRKLPNKFEGGNRDSLAQIARGSSRAADAIASGSGPISREERLLVGRARFPDKKSGVIKAKFLSGAARAKAAAGLRRGAAAVRRKEEAGFVGSTNAFVQQERAAAVASQKASAVDQRERFVASGKSKDASPEEVAAAQVSQIRKGNVVVTDSVTGRRAGVVNDLVFSVRQPAVVPRESSVLDPGIVRSERTGRSVLVFAGGAPRDAREAFGRLGAPKRELLADITFGRKPTPTLKEDARALLGLGNVVRSDVPSRRSKVFRTVVTAENEATAQFGGLPGPGTFEVLSEEREDFARQSRFEVNAPGLAAKVSEVSSSVNAFDVVINERAVKGDSGLIRGISKVGGVLESGFSRLGGVLESNVGRFGIGPNAPVAAFALAEVGRGVKEKPLTAGVGEAVLLGAGFGLLSKGIKVFRNVRAVKASRLLSGVGVVARGVEVAGGVGLTTAFAVGTGRAVGSAVGAEAKGGVLGGSLLEAGGFVGGFKLAGVGARGVGVEAKAGVRAPKVSDTVLESPVRVPRVTVEKVPDANVQLALGRPAPARGPQGFASLRAADRFGVVLRVPEVAPRAGSLIAGSLPSGVRSFGEGLLTARNLGPSRIGRLVDSGVDAVSRGFSRVGDVIPDSVLLRGVKGVTALNTGLKALLTARNLGPSRVGSLIKAGATAGPFAGEAFFPPKFFGSGNLGRSLLTARNLGPSRIGNLIRSKIPALPDGLVFGLPRVFGRAARVVPRLAAKVKESNLIIRASFGGRLALVRETVFARGRLSSSRAAAFLSGLRDFSRQALVVEPRLAVQRFGSLVSRASLSARLGLKSAFVFGRGTQVLRLPKDVVPKVPRKPLFSLSGFVSPRELVFDLRAPVFGRLFGGRVDRGLPDSVLSGRVNEFKKPVEVLDVAEPVSSAGLVTVLKPSEPTLANPTSISSDLFKPLAGGLSGSGGVQLVELESVSRVRDLPGRESAAGFFAGRVSFAERFSLGSIDIASRLSGRQAGSSLRDLVSPKLDVDLGVDVISQLDTVQDVVQKPRERQRVLFKGQSQAKFSGFLRTVLTADVPVLGGGLPLLSSAASGVPGFRVLVRRQGRFQLASLRSFSKAGALSFGALLADKTPAQTVELVRAGRVFVDDEPSESRLKALLSKFSVSKGGLRLQEKQAFLIDSAGEFRDITFKGVRASARARRLPVVVSAGLSRGALSSGGRRQLGRFGL